MNKKQRVSQFTSSSLPTSLTLPDRSHSNDKKSPKFEIQTSYSRNSPGTPSSNESCQRSNESPFFSFSAQPVVDLKRSPTNASALPVLPLSSLPHVFPQCQFSLAPHNWCSARLTAPPFVCFVAIASTGDGNNNLIVFLTSEMNVIFQLKHHSSISSISTADKGKVAYSSGNIVHIASPVSQNNTIFCWEKENEFTFDSEVSSLAWKAIGNEFLFIALQDCIILVNSVNGKQLWKFQTAFPAYHLSCSEAESRIAFCARIDKIVRIVGEDNHVQYLSHQDNVLSVCWSRSANRVDKTKPSSLLTLDVRGVVRLFVLSESVFVLTWTSGAAVANVQWVPLLQKNPEIFLQYLENTIDQEIIDEKYEDQNSSVHSSAECSYNQIVNQIISTTPKSSQTHQCFACLLYDGTLSFFQVVRNYTQSSAVITQMASFKLYSPNVLNPVVFFRVGFRLSFINQHDNSVEFPFLGNTELVIIAVQRNRTAFSTQINAMTRSHSLLKPLGFFGGSNKIVSITDRAHKDCTNRVTFWDDEIKKYSKMIMIVQCAKLFCPLRFSSLDIAYLYAIINNGKVQVFSISPKHICIAETQVLLSNELAENSIFLSLAGFEKDQSLLVLISGNEVIVWKFVMIQESGSFSLRTDLRSNYETDVFEEFSTISTEEQVEMNANLELFGQFSLYSSVTCATSLTLSFLTCQNIFKQTINENKTQTVLPFLLCCHEDKNICLWGIIVNESESEGKKEQKFEKSIVLSSLFSKNKKKTEFIPLLDTPGPFDFVCVGRLGVGMVRFNQFLYLLDFRLTPTKIHIQRVEISDKFLKYSSSPNNVSNKLKASDEPFTPVCDFWVGQGESILAIAQKNSIQIVAPTANAMFEIKWTMLCSLNTEQNECTALHWNKNGTLVCAFGNTLRTFHPWSVPHILTLPGYSQSNLIHEVTSFFGKESVISDEQETTFELVASFWSPFAFLQSTFLRAILPIRPFLPSYHPSILTSLVHEGKRASLTYILRELFLYLSSKTPTFLFIEPKNWISEQIAISELRKSLENTLSEKKVVKDETSEEFLLDTTEEEFMNEILSQDDDNVISYLLSKVISDLSPYVQKQTIPYLTSIEQMQILAILNTIEQTSSIKGSSFDSCGLRFLISKRLFLHRSITFKLKDNVEMSPSEFVWALHSESQNGLFEDCCSGNHSWETLRTFGCGYWITTSTLVRTLIEYLSKTQFAKTKQPADSALFFLLLGKKSTLATLYRHNKDLRIARFLAHDFTDPKWKQAAVTSAYTLASQQKFALCAAFFVLAGDIGDAVHIILNRMNDVQLALIVARFKDRNDLVEKILKEYVIPKAEVESDVFLTSIAYFLLHDKKAAYDALTNIKKTSNKLDPSLLSYLTFFETLPSIKLLNLRESTKETNDSKSNEFDFGSFYDFSYTKRKRTEENFIDFDNDEKADEDSASVEKKTTKDNENKNPSKRMNKIVKKVIVSNCIQKHTFLGSNLVIQHSFFGKEQSEETNKFEDALSEKQISFVSNTTKEKWENTLLSHILLNAAESTILFYLRGSDDLFDGKKSFRPKFSQKSLEFSKSLIDYWTRMIGLDETEINLRVCRGLVGMGYWGTLLKFPNSFFHSYISNKLQSFADSFITFISTFSIAFDEGNELINSYELIARRIYRILIDRSLSFNFSTRRILHIIVYFFFFITLLLRCDISDLKLFFSEHSGKQHKHLFSSNPLHSFESLLQFLLSSMPVERIIFKSFLSCNFIIGSEALKLFAIRIDSFEKNSTDSLVNSIFQALKKFAISHSVHFLAKEVQNKREEDSLSKSKRMNSMNRIIDFENDFISFATSLYTQSLLNDIGWRIPKRDRGKWVEKTKKTVIVNISDPIACFCLEEKKRYGVFSSQGNTYEFSVTPISIERAGSALDFGQDSHRSHFSDRKSERVFRTVFVPTEKKSGYIKNQANISADWISPFTNLPYYLVCCDDNPPKLFHFLKDVSSKPFAEFRFGNKASFATRCTSNADGTLVAAALKNSGFEIWSVPKMTPANVVRESLFSHDIQCKRTNDIVFLNEGNIITTATTGLTKDDSTVCLWDIREPLTRASISAPMPANVPTPPTSEGSYSLSSYIPSSTSPFLPFSANTLSMRQHIPSSTTPPLISISAGFPHSLKSATTSSPNSSPKMYDQSSELRPIVHTLSGAVTTIGVSDDKLYLVAGDIDGNLHEIDVRTFRVTRSIKAHRSAIKSLSLSSTTITTGSSDAAVSVWQRNTFLPIVSWENEHDHHSILSAGNIHSGTTKVVSFYDDVEQTLTIFSSGSNGVIVQRTLAML